MVIIVLIVINALLFAALGVRVSLSRDAPSLPTYVPWLG